MVSIESIYSQAGYESYVAISSTNDQVCTSLGRPGEIGNIDAELSQKDSEIEGFEQAHFTVYIVQMQIISLFSSYGGLQAGS